MSDEQDEDPKAMSGSALVLELIELVKLPEGQWLAPIGMERRDAVRAEIDARMPPRSK